MMKQESQRLRGNCPTLRRFGTTVSLFLMVLGLLSGCQSAHDPQPIAEKFYAGDDDTQLEFWHTLANRKIATYNEAFHGLLLYLDGNDAANDYGQRVSLMKKRGLLAPDFHANPDDAVTRGALAVPIARAVKLKGGLMMNLVGANERYATRELQFAGLYPPSSPNQIFSGAEFVGIIGKLDDYQHGVPAPVTGRLSE